MYKSMNSAADSLQQIVSKQGRKSSNLSNDVAGFLGMLGVDLA